MTIAKRYSNISITCQNSLINKLLTKSYLNCALITLAFSLVLFNNAVAAEQNVYFGTGTKSGDGIYHSVLNENDGSLSQPKKVANIASPGFLAKHPNLGVLYAVARHKTTPVVAAYKILDNHQLSLINQIAINDGGAAHISVHPSGKFLLTAQYGGGSVALFSLGSDGNIIKREQLIKHQGGSKVVKGRQNKPHPHWVGFSPDGRFAFVPDLGMDAIVIYQVNNDKISAYGKANSVSGGGPRHMRFSKNGEFIHLLNEFTLSISTYAYDSNKGEPKLVETVPTLSNETQSQEAFNSASEILVHPTGNFVYSANRGHDSISVFRSNEESGQLTQVETEHVRGAFPRNINLDNRGKWLLAAGQHSNTVSVFAIDQASGKLQYQTNSTINLPEPICILFIE